LTVLFDADCKGTAFDALVGYDPMDILDRRRRTRSKRSRNSSWRTTRASI
jgi:hypothetical protein